MIWSIPIPKAIEVAGKWYLANESIAFGMGILHILKMILQAILNHIYLYVGNTPPILQVFRVIYMGTKIYVKNFFKCVEMSHELSELEFK